MSREYADLDLNKAVSQGDIDLRMIYPGTFTEITERDRLGFAKWILLWLAAICIGVFVGYGMFPENKAMPEIFELVKIGALPLITLVISFYFPSKNK